MTRAFRPPHTRIRRAGIALLSAAVALAARAADTPAPEPVARLQVTSDPVQATVLIDRQTRGETPLTINQLAPGKHLVTVRKDGFLDAYQSVELAAQDSRAVAIKLEPILGLVLAISSPSNADVTASGVDLGRTPVVIVSLPLGRHRLKFATPGYQPKEIEINVEDRRPLRVTVDLASDSATLTVETDAANAQVLVNGIDRGAAPCKIERIPEGEITIEVRAEGYAPFQQKMKLAAGEVQTARVTLTPLPASLRIVAMPEKARVYLNDEFKGVAPLDLPNLKPGSYRVRVELEGYDPDARTIELLRGAAKTEQFGLIANTGRLELTTEPAGVAVLVDGRKAGETKAKPDATTAVSDPFGLDGLVPGEHELRLVRKGYYERTQKVKIEQGKTATLHVTLPRRFIPDYQITTERGVYRGVLDSITDEFIRLETAPGVMMTIQLKDVRMRHTLREDDKTE